MYSRARGRETEGAELKVTKKLVAWRRTPPPRHAPLAALASVVVLVPAVACSTRRAPAPVSEINVAADAGDATPTPTPTASVAEGGAAEGGASPVELPSPTRDADAGPRRRVPPPRTAAGCEALLASAQHELDAARAKARVACANDSDCVTTTARACLSDCGSSAIAKTSAPDYEATVARVRETSCRAWWDGPCSALTPKPTPTCAAYHATCAAGRCAAAFGP